MSDEPENFTLALLRKIDAKVDTLRDEVLAMRVDMNNMRDAMATKEMSCARKSIRCAPTWPQIC